MNFLNTLWQQKKILNYGLLPFSLIYKAIIYIRRFFYKKHFFKVTQFKVPVVVVGNITVGGTGKTPLVIALARLLKEHGYRPGIVSRGYSGNAKHFPIVVNVQTSPVLAGDEPVLIARHAECPVYVAPRRVLAAQRLLSDHFCDVIISDDGLQHYALDRAIEIAVIDGDRRFGNGFCLPAGPLREPAQRLKSVDFIICNGAAQAGEYPMQLTPLYFQSVNFPHHKQSIDYFKNKRVHAVAGIGNPARFFKQLRALGLTVIEHPFPDHYVFKKSDFTFANQDIVVMTEKDAVKCQAFAGENDWYLAVEAQLPLVFQRIFLDAIKKQVESK